MSKSIPPPKLPKQFYRMWHRKQDDWCHAWDVEASAFRSWKEGNTPLSRMVVFLPDGTNPPIRSQVVCGTCKSAHLVPKEMKTEFMRL